MDTMFRGSGVAIVTPFRDGAIDWEAFAKVIEFQIAGGTDAIFACGTTGEPSTMTAEERAAVVSFTIKQVAGRVPVFAGSGSNSTAEAIATSQTMQALGADGLLVVTPYYNKATQAGLVAHYRAIADAVDIPIVAYNVPGRTGTNMLPQTVLELSAHPNIAAIKEACGDLQQIMELFRLCRGKLSIYVGNDDHVFPMMALGGDGVISVSAHIVPQEMHDIVATYLAGDIEESRRIQEAINPLVAQLFTEVNPIPVKAALAMMGQIEDELRLPLTPMSEGPRQELRREMVAYGVI